METLEEVAQLIQLAIAPVFLLTAVAATLTVFAGRLARIVDRGRLLEAKDNIDAAVLRDFEAARTAALCFMGALFSYTGAIICLLREVFLAVGSFRLGIREASRQPAA